MSAPDDPLSEAPLPSVDSTPDKAVPKRKMPKWLRRTLWGVLAFLVLVPLSLAVWLGIGAPGGWSMAQAALDGRQIGRYGTLNLQELSGTSSGFSLKSAQLVDEEGVWLRAEGADVDWQMLQLLSRRVAISDLSVNRIIIERQPVLGPKTGGGKLPVDVAINRFAAELVLEPNVFGGMAGSRHATQGSLNLTRNGSTAVRLESRSRDGPAQTISANINMEEDKPLQIAVDAQSARGGFLGAMISSPQAALTQVSLGLSGDAQAGKGQGFIRSDDTTLAQFDMQWTEANGSMLAQLGLPAESWLGGQTARFGPLITLRGQADRESRESRPVAMVLESAAMTARLQGEVDFADRRLKDGGTLTINRAALQQLSQGRITGIATGAFRLEGGFPETGLEGVLEGNLVGADVAGFGLRLSSLGGPLRLQAREGNLEVTSRLLARQVSRRVSETETQGDPPDRFTLDLNFLHRQEAASWQLRRANLTGDGVNASFKGQIDDQRKSLNGRATLEDLQMITSLVKGRANLTIDLSQNQDQPWQGQARLIADRLSSQTQAINDLVGNRLQLDLAPSPTAEAGNFTFDLRSASLNASGLLNPAARVPLRGQWRLDRPFSSSGVVLTSGTAGLLARRGPNGALAYGPAGLAIASRNATIAISGWTITDAAIMALGGTAGRPINVSVEGIAPLGPVALSGALETQPGGIDLTQIMARHAGLQAQGNATARGSRFDGLFDLNVEPGAVLTSGASSGRLGIAVRDGKVGVSADMALTNARLKGVPIDIPQGRLRANGLLDALNMTLTGTVANGSQTGSLNLSAVADLSGDDTSVVVQGGGVYAGEAVRLNSPLRAAPLGSRLGVDADISWSDYRLVLAGRMNQGGFAVRTAQVRGPSLIAQVSGQLGGESSNLRGTVRQTDLSSLNARLGGTARGDLQISNNSQGLRARVVGSAQNLDLSSPDLNRLLGRQPRFDLVASAPTGGTLSGNWSFTGAQLSGRGNVTPSGEGNLPNLQGSWRLVGPVQFGNLEVSGDLAGGIALDGGRLGVTATAPTLSLVGQTWRDVNATAAIANVLDLSTIPISVRGEGSFGPLRAEAALRHGDQNPTPRLDPLSFNYGGLVGTGRLSFPEVGPNGVIDLRATQGVLVSSGQANGQVTLTTVNNETQLLANLQLVNAGLNKEAITRTNGNLRISGPLDNLSMSLNADLVAGQQPVGVRLAGRLVETGNGRDLTVTGGGTLQGAPWQIVEPLRASLGEDVTRASGRLSWRSATIAFNGSLSENRIDLEGQLSDVPASLLATQGLSLDGRFDGNVRVQGRTGAFASGLTGSAQLRATGLKAPRGDPREAINGTLDATLNGNSVVFRGQASNAQGLTARGDARLPIIARLNPFQVQVVRTAPIGGQFDVSGPIGALVKLGLSPQSTASGNIAANGTLAGTFTRPSIQGRIEATNVGLRDPRLGVRITEGNALVTFNGPNAQIERFSARDGKGGQAQLAGQINLTRNAPWQLSGQLTRFQLIDSATGLIVASGPWTLASTGQAINLGGTLELDTARIGIPSGSAQSDVLNVREINRPAALGPAPAQPKAGISTGPATAQGANSASGLGLDLKISSSGNARVVGRGFDGYFDLDTTIKGTTDAPRVLGRAELVRGRFDLAGRSFDLTTGRVDFLEPLTASRIRFVAERESADLTAIASIEGTLGQPAFELTSTPSAPEDEILSRILFGRNVAALSLAQSTQLALGLASLTTGTQLDPAARLGQALGLERLSLGSESGGFSGLTAGLRLVRDVYVEVATGGEDGTVTMLEWRPRRRVQVQVTTSQQRESTVSVRFRSRDER